MVFLKSDASAFRGVAAAVIAASPTAPACWALTWRCEPRQVHCHKGRACGGMQLAVLRAAGPAGEPSWAI